MTFSGERRHLMTFLNLNPQFFRQNPEPTMQAVTHSDLLNPHYAAWRDFLRLSEGWTAEQIRDYQVAQLRRILQLAYDKTASYRQIFDDAGVSPSSFQSLDDLARIPFTTKEDIRDNLSGFTVKTEGCDYVTTGGSTGIPFGFYRNKEAFGKELASKAHQYARRGWKEGDRQIVFRGIPLDTESRTKFYPDFNELRCSSYHLTPERMEAFREQAWEYRPDWVRCYPSTGHLIAQFLNDSGQRFPPLKGILCASENLYDFQKELMGSIFGCQIFSHYGHYELAVLAGFCETSDTYHVLPQYGYAELVDERGNIVTTPGETGEIVGTSFLMEATPFIRYRTRDFAVLKSWGCAHCGRPYQVWERISGRLQEFIVTGTGRLISMTAINMHDDIFDHIRQFQFFQEDRGKVAFRFIPKATCNAAVVEDMRNRLLVKLGGDTELAMTAVDEIPPTHRGKHRFLIQNLTGVSAHDA